MKVGVALAGGGLKGVAYIGALKAFEELGIKIDYISGTSSGSMAASLYAMGCNPDEIKKIIFESYKNLVKIPKKPIISSVGTYITKKQLRLEGLISGERVENLIQNAANEKKYKNGFHYINDGIELCFGITEYGKNTYTLTYDITNFVVTTTDGYQMIYWTLFPYNYDQSPQRVYIKIHSDFRYSDTLAVWGYGKYGVPTYVYDGYIEMDSEETVYSSEYMTIL